MLLRECLQRLRAQHGEDLLPPVPASPLAVLPSGRRGPLPPPAEAGRRPQPAIPAAGARAR
ncbi:MAG: hypothetical protein QM750_03120 [Rubrivivax sp.]